MNRFAFFKKKKKRSLQQEAKHYDDKFEGGGVG